MMTRFSGGCMCGAVHYEGLAEPVFAAQLPLPRLPTGDGQCVRHYASSRRAVLSPSRGRCATTTSPGRGGDVVSRGFCPTCGARLFTKPADNHRTS